MGRGKRREEVEDPIDNLVITLGDTPKWRVIGTLLRQKETEWTKFDLAKEANVSRTTLDRIVEDFLSQGIILVAREIGHITLYKLNTDSRVSRALQQFFVEAAWS